MPPSDGLDVRSQVYECDQCLDAENPPLSCITDGIKPKLRHFVLSLDMHMWWFIPITGIEEKSIKAYRQNCRHGREFIGVVLS